MAKSRRRGGINSRRRLGFELLEERRVLSVSVGLASRSAIESTSADGESGSSGVIVSGNGRFVVFDSNAHNLVSGFGSVPYGSHNLFRFDRVMGETILVSVAASGDEYGNGYCTVLGVSDDGNTVLFTSSATNLHPLDTTSDVDSYSRSITAGTTQLVNVNADGTSKIASSYLRNSLSADGTLVVFTSASNDLHPLDQNSRSDVFVRSLTTGVLDLVSINVAETSAGNASSGSAQISANGRMVVFSSSASDLHPLDTNEIGQRGDLYARNLLTGETHLVTVNATETAGIDASASYYFSMSANGMRITFETSSSKLHPDDQRNDDVFVRDLSTGTTHWISDGASNTDRPTISENGRLIAYWYGGNTLKTFDMETGTSTQSTGGSLFNTQSPSISGDGTTIAFDVFEGNNLRTYVRNVVSGELKAIGKPGIGSFQLRSGVVHISRDGSTIVFTGTAATLVEGDHNGKLDVFSFDVSTGEVQLVSQRGRPESSSTAAGWSNARRSAVSVDGRYVVFTSDAGNLVANMSISPGVRNVYRYDRITGETVLVSVNVDGTGGGDRDSGDDGANRENEINPSISADGNVVAFVSWARNLDAREKNGGPDVYVREVAGGTTHLVSLNMAGTAGVGGYHPLISADGNRVVFSSSGQNLQSIQVSGQQIYVRDLHEGVTHLVSVAWSGVESADRSIDDTSGISINHDGSVIAFVSDARNLHPLQTNDNADNVFVRNMETGTTYLASVNTAGTGSANHYSYSPILSADGTSVAFLSNAGNLHLLKPNTSPYNTDAFVRNLITNETHLASLDATGTRGANENVGNLSMSADGRIVAFETSANNITVSDLDTRSDVFTRDLSLGITTHASNDVSATGFVNASAYQSTLSADGLKVAFVSFGAVLVRSLATGESTLVVSGTAFVGDDSIHTSYSPSLSSDGSVIAFWSEASDLVERDWNDADDVFVATLVPAVPVLPGDYNLDGHVDAADYSVWRNAMGQTGLVPYSGADGSGNGSVGQEDHAVWKAHFGESLPVSGSSVGTLMVSVPSVTDSVAVDTPQPLGTVKADVELKGAKRRDVSPFGGALVTGLTARPQRTAERFPRGDAGQRGLRIDPRAVDMALSAWIVSRRFDDQFPSLLSRRLGEDGAPVENEHSIDDVFERLDEPLCRVPALVAR